MASDGALRLGSTQIIKNPMASLSKGLLVEKNYKGIGHVCHWLVAVNPCSWQTFFAFATVRCEQPAIASMSR